ncbi:MAG: 4-alpha-glucanotransferase [Oscillospiraceae bacterium]
MRSCGILMPISSLPGPFGIGSLGSEAFAFVDFLKKSGQRFWQILPIGPTGYGDSPYQSFSAFAANPYFIDLELLHKDGLLTEAELQSAKHGDDDAKINYGRLFETRYKILEKAVNRFDFCGRDYARFCEENRYWLDDYALFMAIKEDNGMVAFSKWPQPLRSRNQDALNEARYRLGPRVGFWCIVQYFFHCQWVRLKQYANDNGIDIIGDIPIYVSPDSSDLWANGELFQIDAKGTPTEVAGCPPDAFSASGQLWGNPLYAWEYHKRTGYEWWLRRMRHAGEIYDVVRIDHFRGFAGYYAIAADAKDAINGNWRKGPGNDFIYALQNGLPNLRIIAEDLGYLTPEVRELLATSGYPGMKVLQFAFDSREESDYLPHNYTANSVVYTGTHDNTTTEDWQFSAPVGDVAFARRYLDAPCGSLTPRFVRAALESVANTAIIPLADWLCLGKNARINTPSTSFGNWNWRGAKSAFSDIKANEIRTKCRLYGR